MNRPCTMGRHAPAPGAVRNQGLDFGRCRRCGRDLVRSRRAWKAVPAGFRVVWRQAAARPPALSADQLLLDLPATGRALALPDGHLRRRSRVATAIELVVLGARGLAWALADRFRAWAAAWAAPRPAAPPLLGLPAA